jgi:hypothetical protein
VNANSPIARLLGALALAAALAAAALPAAAGAAALHTTPAFSPITGSGIGASFALPLGVGVDESNGNIFVPSASLGNNVDNAAFVLNSEGGAPVGVASPFKVTGLDLQTQEEIPYVVPAVDSSPTSPSKGALYVPEEKSESVKKYVRNPGTEQYELVDELTSVPSLGAIGAVAVDDDGNVYVVSAVGGGAEFGSITKFSPAGAQLARIVMTAATKNLATIAVDSAGDVFAAGAGKAFKFPANGLGEIEASNFVQIPFQGNAPVPGVAVDRATNTLFVASGDGVTELDATTLIEKGIFKFPGGSHRGFIAVNHTAGLIYTARFFNPNDIPVLTLGGPTLADTGTTPPTGVTMTKATLHGVVNPLGLAVSDCEFHLTNPSMTLPCEGAIPTDSSPHQVTAQLTGLGVHSSHIYSLSTTNANGANSSADKNLTTEPIARTDPATAIGTLGATLNGTVRTEGAPLSECAFEYGPTTAYGTSVPCSPEAGSIPDDAEGHAVSAAISGLVVGQTYHFRVRASGGIGSESGEDRAFTTLGPTLGRTYVGLATEDSATLSALVNPRGKATTYHFEYGPTAAYGNTAPAPDASAGSINATQPVSSCPKGCIPYAVASTLAKGLSPGTTYHFRIVVTNPDGTGTGPDATFTTYGSPQPFGACPNDAFRAGEPSPLPDCRAYEQASPIDKNGGGAGGNDSKVQASISGDGITSQTQGGLPGAEGSQENPIFLSHRGPGSWSTQGFLPPPSFGDKAVAIFWTPDLAYSFLRASIAPASEDHALLLRSSSTRAIQQVTPYLHGAEYAFAGGSADDSKLFFEAEGPSVNLTGDAATGKPNLYLYEPGSEEVSLVGALPNGTAPPKGSFAGPYNWRNDDLGRGGAHNAGINSSGGYTTGEMHAVSADGSKAFFTAGGTGQVYMREGIGTEAPQTFQASASQRSTPDPNGPKPAVFMGATPDGSVAFIASCEKLTDDSTAHSTAANSCLSASQGMDLYAYDTASHQLSDLTVDAGDPQGMEAWGLLGASEDGSYVYFAANADLDGAGPAEAGNCHGLEGGGCNAYLWHNGTTSFVAAGVGPNNWFPGGTEGLKLASVSADGKALAFYSQRSLTGYDNRATAFACGSLEGGSSSQSCFELYRYQADEESISCLSCVPTGGPPTDSPTLATIEDGVTAFIRPIGKRFASASGDQVFFETRDKLVGADVNGDQACPYVRRPSYLVARCQDVYEWEAPGAGSCAEASPAFSPLNGGCLYLLSSGASEEPAFFGDASASGDDAFIFTDGQLVPGDQDRLTDIYDARVGGGLAGQHQPPPPPPCEAEACRGAPSAAPSGPSAGSASFRGPGDPPVARCPKGKSLKGGRCVKRHKPKKHHKKHRAKRAGADQKGRK